MMVMRRRMERMQQESLLNNLWVEVCFGNAFARATRMAKP